MSNVPLEKLHKVLDALESKENALLVWGDTGGFFNDDELREIIQQEAGDENCDDVIVQMIDAAMLIQVPHSSGFKIWRSRMGESVHLYRNLRQWFLNKPLEESRTLVSDFRFIRQQRTYPKREEIPEMLLKQWRESLPLNEREVGIMRAALEPMDSFRLAGFQKRATERIIQFWRRHSGSVDSSSGSIVCAGTGSGKTLSFYLPALTSLANEICGNPQARVRILAIYPRKELLKDQFAETYAQCRKLDGFLQAQGARKIRIGSYYGDTVKNRQDAQNKLDNFAGLPFELLRCPVEHCDGEMQWRREDIEANNEILTCVKCRHTVDNSEVMLTRYAQYKNIAPDIIFTTTEMLNQQLNNKTSHALFGIGKGAGPTLVLLDEVHTYGGSTGAQTAFLLRRWMQRGACLPHFVGLSATLADAQSFFAQLIGSPVDNVALIQPHEEEMKAEGAEYLLALRGDPVSETALLSTTIQTSMLTSRLLDSKEAVAQGTWGQKTFVFTDNLDGINRLYSQLSDAEGWDVSGDVPVAEHAPLASLRASQNSGKKQTELGQNWRISENIGHLLSERKRVSRTSSQDAGVDQLADIVVATASLEVGYNDPLVGAVIQHKSPSDVASYLQRKGRAGRLRGMRPWMLIVLSEFGRDRVAFQRYEELISPEVKRQGLPMCNQHIQKMQAAMATLDWLSQNGNFRDIWAMLRYPDNTEYNRKQYHALQVLIGKILQGGAVLNSLTRYLGHALQLKDAEIQPLLWNSPRSLMFEFLPTVQRYLKSYWAENGKPWSMTDSSRGSPVPEFIPQTLFNELNLPTLLIRLQRGIRTGDKWEGLSFWQGMREFAPGRLSKRYAVTTNRNTDWLVPEGFNPTPGNYTVNFPINDAFGDVLQLECSIEHEGRPLNIIKPFRVMTKRADITRISDKSNSQLYWHLYLVNPFSAIRHDVPKGPWYPALRDVSFFSHQHMTPLEVVRYTTGALASLRFKNKQKDRAHIDFLWTDGTQSAGIGARQWVDAMRLRFVLDRDTVAHLVNQPDVLRGLRPVYFQHLVSMMPEFEFDEFKANWVMECFQACLAEIMVMQPDMSLREALAFIATESGVERLVQIPASLFQPDLSDEDKNEQQLQLALQDLLSSAIVQQQLLNCADALWKPVEYLDGFIEWARQVLADTLCAGVHQTLCSLLPDVDERAVVTESRWDRDAANDIEWLEVWLSEVESGGCGILIRLQETWFSDPVQFLNIMVRNLAPGDYEQIDFDLLSLLETLKDSSVLREVFRKVREAENYEARRESNKQLQLELRRLGFRLSHSFTTVLYSRILRAGSSESTDADLQTLLAGWRQLEDRAEIEFNLNIVAHALAFGECGPHASFSDTFQTQCRNQNLLWPRGYTIRQAELNHYNPFSSRSSVTERLLAGVLFDANIVRVEGDSSHWLEDVHIALRKHGRVDLLLPKMDPEAIHTYIAILLIEPLDYLGLLLYPRIGELRREKGIVILRVEMAEVVQ